VLLLRIKLWELESGHIIDEKVVADLTVSENTLLMSLGNSLGKDTRVFTVEKKVYPSELAVFFLVIIPVASVEVALVVVGVNKNWSPKAAG
jgi:hypothetical protein